MKKKCISQFILGLSLITSVFSATAHANPAPILTISSGHPEVLVTLVAAAGVAGGVVLTVKKHTLIGVAGFTTAEAGAFVTMLSIALASFTKEALNDAAQFVADPNEAPSAILAECLEKIRADWSSSTGKDASLTDQELATIILGLAE